MAVRNIAVTDTIEKFRTEFNAMTLNDFGDIANLDASLSATNLVDAMNETLAAATNTAGFRIEDSSSTQQLISGGDVLRVFGTTNEIEAVVSATDRLTIGLPNAVSVTTSLTAPTLTTGNLSLTGDSFTAIGTDFDTTSNVSITNSNVHISSTDFKVIANSIFESTTHKITGESTVQGGIDLSSRTIFVDGQGIPQINNESSVVNFGGRNLIMSDLDNSSDGLLKLETDEEFLMESKTRDRLEHTRQGTLISGENFGLGHVINFDVGVGKNVLIMEKGVEPSFPVDGQGNKILPNTQAYLYSIIDKEGRATTDPAAFKAGGPLLPLGGTEGYKGYGLSAMIEIFSGILTGLGHGVEPTGRHNDGCFMAVFKVEAFRPLDIFKKEVTEFLEQMNSSQFKDIESFFTTMPKLRHEVEVLNPKTKKSSKVVLEGLASFFA